MNEYYGRFSTFLAKLAKYNSSQDVGERAYEYFLAIFQMLASVAGRCQDLLTIGFQYLLLEPDIRNRYGEAVNRVCEVAQALQDE